MKGIGVFVLFQRIILNAYVDIYLIIDKNVTYPYMI